MKAKKRAASRRKLNFAVDREEIEINSDWVQAVMGPLAPEGAAPAGRLFFDAGTNNATEARSATGVEKAPVEETTTVAGYAPVARSGRQPRPKPIRRVTDGLTGGQFAVYSLIFENAVPEQGDAGRGSRLYRGGYADLCRLTGLSKRGVQNIIAGLEDKRVIALAQPPGHHRTETSVYRVWPGEAVVEGWHARGLRFAFGKSKTLSGSATVARFATVA